MVEVTVLPNASQEAVPPASDETKVGAATRWQCLLPGDGQYVRWIGGTAFVDYTVSFANPTLPTNGSVLYGYLTWRQSASRGTAKYVNTQFRCYPKAPFVGTGVSYAYLNSTLQPVFVADGAFHTDDASKAHQGGINAWTYDNGSGLINLTWDDLDLSTMQVVQHINNQGDTPVDLKISELSLTYVVDEAPTLTNVRVADSITGLTRNRRPTIVWDYADADGQPQTQYRVLIYGNGDQDLGGDFPPGVIPDGDWNISEVTPRYDSGWQSGTANSWRVGLDMLTPPVSSTGWYAFVAVSSVTANGRTIYSKWTPSTNITVDVVEVGVVTLLGDAGGTTAYNYLKNQLEITDGRFKLTRHDIDPNVLELIDPLFTTEEVGLSIGGGYGDARLRDATIGVVMANGDYWWPAGLTTQNPGVYSGRNAVTAVESPVTGGIVGTISIYTFAGDVVAINTLTAVGFTANPEELVYSSAPSAMSFAYEAGFPLANGTLAPARRVALGIPQYKIPDLSPAGLALLANELIWAASQKPSQRRTMVSEAAVGIESTVSSREVLEGWGTAL